MKNEAAIEAVSQQFGAAWVRGRSRLPRVFARTGRGHQRGHGDRPDLFRVSRCDRCSSQDWLLSLMTSLRPRQFTWSVLLSSTCPGILQGVSCVNASSCVAVGESGKATLIDSWNGSSWSVVPSPQPARLPVLGPFGNPRRNARVARRLSTPEQRVEVASRQVTVSAGASFGQCVLA